MAESAFVVLKFGGTSVSSLERWETITRVLEDRVASGVTPVVVCSAISGVSNLLERLMEDALTGNFEQTMGEIRERHSDVASELDVDVGLISVQLDDLERLALGASLTREISPRLHARFMAAGELMLTTLGHAYLENHGLACAWVDARDWLRASDAGFQGSKERHFLSAACDYSSDEELREFVESSGVDVVLTQGFIARDAEGETVILGRGGSDTSASYFASKLSAERLEIWTDVPGMYTANPREVPSARLLKQLHYDEAQEIASMGAKVLHPRCLAPVRERGIPLQIRCTQRPDLEGTVISGEAPDSGAQVKAISSKGGVMLVSMETLGMWQQVGFLADIFGCFKRHGVSVDLVATSESNVTVSLDPAANVLDPVTRRALLEDLAEHCDAKMIGPTAAVSLVGQKIRATLHQLGPALEVFEEQKIYLASQAASDLNLTFVVDEQHAQRLVRKLHDLLFSNRLNDPLLGPSWEELFAAESSSADVDAAWWSRQRESLIELADEETPVYVYDTTTLEERAGEVTSLGLDRAYFAIKANSNPEVLQVFYDAGLGFECVSPEEVKHVLACFPSIDRERIVFTPNFAPLHEYTWAFEEGILTTLDNVSPIEEVPEVFAGQRVLIRIDPGHGRGHHKKVKTAGAQSKFGISPQRVARLRELIEAHDLDVVGLHAHVGSGITFAENWADTAIFLAKVADELGGSVRILNLGGGLGIPDKPGQPRLDMPAVRASLDAFREARPEFELWMEPGRYLVAESGVLLARVTQTKAKLDHRWYVGVDVGMNSLIRPALYGAYHPIYNLSRIDAPSAIVADVVGPICETGDVLGHQRRLPDSSVGDVVLIGNAGAYGAVMGSNYNMRPVARERMLKRKRTDS